MRKLLYIVIIFTLCIYCGPKQQEIERYMEDGVEVVVNHLKPYKIKGKPSNLILEEEFTIDTERDEKTDCSNGYMYDIFNPDGVFTGRRDFKSLKIPKKNRGYLYITREKESGYKELVVYKIKWEHSNANR